MKSLKIESTRDLLNEFALSTEEMIYVRGGGDPIVRPSDPPIKI